MTLNQQKIDDFIQIRRKEGANQREIIAMRSCYRRFQRFHNDINSNIVNNYLANFNTIKDTSKEVYRRFLYQLSDFCEGKPRTTKQDEINFGLLEIALSSSYVDDYGILRVKFSNVPALVSWIKILKRYSDLVFDYDLSLRFRKRHNERIQETIDQYSQTKRSKTRKRGANIAALS